MKHQKRRMQILQEMATIERMEKGQLTEEYRDSLKQGRTEQLGPYYKYQRWEEGRNLSRRVPEVDVPSLRTAIEGYHRYEALAKEYADITIEMTRQTPAADIKKKPRSRSQSY